MVGFLLLRSDGTCLMLGSRKMLRRRVSVAAVVVVAALPYVSAHCLAMAGRVTGGHPTTRYESSNTSEGRAEPGPVSEPACCASVTKSIVSMPSRQAAAGSPIWVSIDHAHHAGALAPSRIAAPSSGRRVVYGPAAYLQYRRLRV